MRGIQGAILRLRFEVVGEERVGKGSYRKSLCFLVDSAEPILHDGGRTMLHSAGGLRSA